MASEEATKEMVIEFRREAQTQSRSLSQTKSQAADNDNKENVNETMTQVVGT